MATIPGETPAVRWRWLLPVLAVLALFQVTGFRETLDHAFFDRSVRLGWQQPMPPEGSALVLMDNATLAMLSEQGLGVTWPPPRAVFAALIIGLERAGATRIVLDFAFLENSSAEDQDHFLGALAAAVPGVVLGHMPGRPVAVWPEAFRAAHPDLFARPRSGSVAATTDPDGVIRRYTTEDSLAEAAFGARASSRGGLLRWHGGLEALRLQTERVPVLSAARFVRAGLDHVTPLADAAPDFAPAALQRALAARPALAGPGFDAVRGRVVFVGTNAEGTFDQKPLALGGLEPGVLVPWTAWANLVSDQFIQPLPSWLPPLLALAGMGGLLWLAGGQRRLRGPALVVFAWAGGLLGFAQLGLAVGWYLPPSLPVLAASLTFVGLVAESFWTEHRRRREIQAMFGSYVAPEVVETLVRDPAAIRLGGERREATVFFCDLAGFTDLSEQVKPEELLELINGYLEETSDALMEHGAYIDKYIGDAVMAVFGAPKPDPQHALSACRAALAAQAVLARRNTLLAARHGRTLHMRIGINSGPMIVGNLGSERKRNYTVLGDAVNLASRLEGANKEFGTRILLGETTAAAVRDTLVLRPLTALRVKGRQTAVQVFELLGERGTLDPHQEAFLAQYVAGHTLYTARRFAEAVPALEQASALVPHDAMTQRLLTSARLLADSPPPPEWQPLLALDSK